MPVIEDWLGDPLSIIDNLFESDQENFEQKVNEYFEKKFNNEKYYNSIPCLNEMESLESLPETCLVRYRCMVQDSFNPVYFNTIQHLKHKKSDHIKATTLKYKETLDHLEDYEVFSREEQLENGAWRVNTDFEAAQQLHQADKKNEFESLKQRLTLYCVPVPGETEWTSAIYRTKNNNSKHTNSQTIAAANAANKGGEFACLVKIYENFDHLKINDIVEFVGILHKNESLAFMHDEHHQQDQMLPSDQQDQQQQQQSSGSGDKMDTDDQLKVVSSYLPSKCPRLHCLKYTKLLHNNPLISTFESSIAAQTQLNDDNENSKAAKEAIRQEISTYWQTELNRLNESLFTMANFREKAVRNVTNRDQILLNELRQELITCLQEFLLGDTLAAEYLLMNLISSVFTRRDVTILGKFSLNLYNVTTPNSSSSRTTVSTIDTIGAKENSSSTSESSQKLTPIATTTSNSKSFTECFFKQISKLLTMSELFPMTVDNLNKANLIPSKDYNKDRLVPGALQLPENFQLIIDETSLSTGQLNQKGILNFNSFKDIIQWQRMNYDFGFHSHEFQTNIRVLILSQTKSILPSDCQMKLKSNSVERFEADAYEAYIGDLLNRKYANLLDQFRSYLTIVSHLDYKLNDAMQKIVEQDIVNIKQQSFSKHLDQNAPHAHDDKEDKNNRMGIDDFHNLLVIARLQSLSYGKTELGINEWNKAKLLEFERLTTRIN